MLVFEKKRKMRIFTIEKEKEKQKNNVLHVSQVTATLLSSKRFNQTQNMKRKNPFEWPCFRVRKEPDNIGRDPSLHPLKK